MTRKLPALFLLAALACSSLSLAADSTDPIAGKCAAGKTLTAGKYALCLASASSTLAATGDSTLYNVLVAKCELRLSKPWSRYETTAAINGGACPKEDDQQAVQEYIDTCMTAVADACNGANLPDNAGELASCQSAAEACSTSLSSCSSSLASCTTTATLCGSGTAGTGEVLAGKTFSGAAGLNLAGTMANNGAINITPGAADQTIVAGYYNGSGKVVGDADLVPGNIRQGANVFGVAGSSVPASGSATAGQVLSGATFSNSSGSGTGTMANRGAVTITPGATDQAIAAGYHNGSGKVVGDADLVAGNIRQGANVFGVAGSSVPASGSATAGQVLSGATFSNSSGSGTGTMTNRGAVTVTPGATDQAIAAGYHNGSGKVVGDADLLAGNIKKGIEVFGVAGSIDVAGYEETIASCSANLASCGARTCGDGVLQAGEDCEVNWTSGTTFTTGSTCAGEGFDAGTLACTKGCGYDTSGCRYRACGDGLVDAPEACDGGNLAGQSCIGLGFLGGTLSCDAGCALDTSACDQTPRFIDNGDGTVTDYSLWVTWEKKDTSGGLHDVGNAYTWSSTGSDPTGTVFTEFVAGLNAGGGFAGQTSWHLPTPQELASLVDCTSGAPCVNPVLGPTQKDSYWTSAAVDSTNARIFDFSGGAEAALAKAGTAYARAVVSGANYVDNGDGTITDRRTGLMWEKKSDDGSIHDADNTYTWSSSGTDPNGTAYTVFLPTLNAGGGFAGHADWRLPTKEELETLINGSYWDSDPATSAPYTFPIFKDGAVPGCSVTSPSCSWTRSEGWWSSETAEIPGDAWYVSFPLGYTNAFYKTYNYAVRAVRTGS